MRLTVTIAEMMAAKRISEAASRGVGPNDIQFARKTDLAPEDVRFMRETTAKFRLFVVLRCPKRGAIAFHGIFRPKRWADGHDSRDNLVKSGLNGVGVHPETGNIFISDYDMMSLWVGDGRAYRKLFAASTVPGKVQGPMSPGARDAIKLFNSGLISRLQHGAQDDFHPPPGAPHPGVDATTRFCAFREGEMSYMEGMAACAAYYAKWGLAWPYDADGRFTGAPSTAG
jgi:hypothetical protein